MKAFRFITLLTKAALNSGRLKFKEASLNLRRLFFFVNMRKKPA